MNLLSIEQVLYIHDVLIEETGGRHGLRDVDLLASAVGRPRSGTQATEFYPTLHGKAAALMHSLVHNHPFVDGNKRTGITAAGIFLSLNGWELFASNEELYAFTMRVVDDDLTVEEIAAWLESHSQRVSG